MSLYFKLIIAIATITIAFYMLNLNIYVICWLKQSFKVL